MENLSVELTAGMLALVPVVAALIQIVKRFLAIPEIPVRVNSLVKELLPLMSIGITFGIMSYQQVVSPLLPAIIIGLTASGGFDLVKKTALKKS